MVVIAAVLGTTYLGNTFQASNSVSNVLFELLAAGALSAVLVPDLRRAASAGASDRRAEEVAGGVLSIALGGARRGDGRSASCSRRSSPSCSRPGSTTRRSPPSSRSSPPTCCASSSRRCCCTPLGAVTTAVLHAQGRFALAGHRPDRQHRRARDRDARVPRDGRARPRPRPRRRRAARASRWAARSGVAAFVAVPAIGLRRSGFRLRLGAAGGRGATRTCGRCSACRAGRPSSTPAPASCWPPR